MGSDKQSGINKKCFNPHATVDTFDDFLTFTVGCFWPCLYFRVTKIKAPSVYFSSLVGLASSVCVELCLYPADAPSNSECRIDFCAPKHKIKIQICNSQVKH